MSKKKKTKIVVGQISGKDSLLRAKGKLGAHNPVVNTGTGQHTDKKRYNRKDKRNQRMSHALKKQYGSDADFYLLRIMTISETA